MSPNVHTRAYEAFGLPADTSPEQRGAWVDYLAGKGAPLRLLPKNGDFCVAVHYGSGNPCGHPRLIDDSCPARDEHRDVVEAARRISGEQAKQAVADLPTECPNCACLDLSWSLAVQQERSNPVGDGRLSMHDVHAVLVLGCEGCSETLAVIREEDELNELVRHKIVIEVPATVQQVRRWRNIERAAMRVDREHSGEALDDLSQSLREEAVTASRRRP